MAGKSYVPVSAEATTDEGEPEKRVLWHADVHKQGDAGDSEQMIGHASTERVE